MIKKLLVNGFSKVRELPQVTEFIQLCLSEYLPSTLRISLLHKVTQKVPECLCKLFYEFVYNDPMSFATYVGPTIKLLIQVLFVEIDNIGLLSERFVLKAVNLFKIILLSEVSTKFMFSTKPCRFLFTTIKILFDADLSQKSVTTTFLDNLSKSLNVNAFNYLSHHNPYKKNDFY